jgi:hypothetical protein
VKIEKENSGTCSAVEKLDAVEISWDQQQQYCGLQAVSGSQVV